MRLDGQHGYAMAALLVALSVMAVLATAAMPVWHQMTQREKEEELIFRGNQYVRAIRLFSAKAGPGVLPPNIDVLVQQRYLRRKFKDPITGQDFDVLSPVQATASTPGGGAVGASTPGGATGGAPTAGRGGAAQPATGMGAVTTAQPATGRGGAVGGVMGVASKSKATSIRLFNGRNHYNEWQFLFVQQVQQPGGPGGRGVPGRGQAPGTGIGGVGGRGGRGNGPDRPTGRPTPFDQPGRFGSPTSPTMPTFPITPPPNSPGTQSPR